MWITIRELLGNVREAIGRRNTLLIVLFLLLVTPLLIAIGVCALPFWLLGAIGLRVIDAARGVGKRLVDPVYGPITYEGGSTWYAERDMEALGGRYSISVTGPRATGPGTVQHELLRELLEREHDIRRQAEQSLYAEYQAVAPRRRKEMESFGFPDFAKTLQDCVPIVEDSAQIWALLSDGSILLEDEVGCFTIFWNCAWDDEHGVSRTFVNWKLEEDEAE